MKILPQLVAHYIISRNNKDKQMIEKNIEKFFN